MFENEQLAREKLGDYALPVEASTRAFPTVRSQWGAGQFTLGTLTHERLASQASVKAKHLVQGSVQAPSGSGQRRGLVDPPPPRTCSLTGCSGAWCSNRPGSGRAHSMARSLAHDGAHVQGRSEPMPLHAWAGFDVHAANTPRPTWASSKGPWAAGPSP